MKPVPRISFLLVSLLLLSTFSSVVMAQGTERYEKKTYAAQNGLELPYRLLLPDNFNPKNRYPLIIFLHGAGERGDDNEAQLVHGSSMFLSKQTDFPSIVVFPQCRKDSYWSSVQIDRNQSPEKRFNYDYSASPQTPDLTAVIELIVDLQNQFKIDKKRIYIMGLSMGGMGTFEAITRHPKLFAAAIPICGGGDTRLVANFAKKVPVWIFHGADDNVVHVNYSRSMVNAMEAAGGKVKYTEYPNVNHNSWDRAFAEPDLLPWLFQHKR